MRLAREHRVTRQALFLRALDLGVPVSAFDKPRRNTPPHVLAEVGKKRQNSAGTTLVGLNREPETVIIAQPAVAEHAFEDLQRDLETIRLFSIDGQGNP